MQINYYYHGKKFKNFNDMINPKINVLWAGYFLLDLREKHGTWKEAIMRYHSSNPRRKKNYYNKVLNNWSYLGTDFKTTVGILGTNCWRDLLNLRISTPEMCLSRLLMTLKFV